MTIQIDVSWHAHSRAEERGLTDEMRSKLETQEPRFRIHAEYGGTAWAAILRVSDGYWVGVIAENALLTVYKVPGGKITDWCWRHLVNEAQTAQVTALPVALSSQESITRELASIWVDNPSD